MVNHGIIEIANSSRILQYKYQLEEKINEDILSYDKEMSEKVSSSSSKIYTYTEYLKRIIIKEIENISYTDEQLDEELSNMALAYNMDVEKIKEILPAEQRGYMAENIAIRNTVEFLNKQTKRI